MNTPSDTLRSARLLAASLALLLSAAAQAETAIQAWVQRYNGPGNNTDEPKALAVDSRNNVIVTGISVGSSGFDYATVQYSSTGVPLWTNRYNGPGDVEDGAAAVVVDRSDNVIVTGYSGTSTNHEYVTIKYSTAGVPLWTNSYIGPGGGGGWTCCAAVDRSDNVIVSGTSSGEFATIEYSSAGMPLWTNRYSDPGNSYAEPSALVVDGSNNVIVTGRSGASGVTIKYSNAGVPLWTNWPNGPAHVGNWPSALAVDRSNNVIVTGCDYDSSGYSWFITTKYSSQGTPAWTNYYREPAGPAYATAIAVDRDDKVFVTGDCYAGLYQDYATVAYSSAGAPLWTNRYDGPAKGSDIAEAVTVDDNNNVIVTGYSSGDYATIKYSNAGVPVWTNCYHGPGTGGCARAMVLDHDGDFIVTGESDGGASGFDYATIKFLSPPVISDAQITNGIYQIRMRRPNTVVVEASTDLASWMPIFTNVTTTNLLIYADPNPGSAPRRFYRAVRVP